MRTHKAFKKKETLEYRINHLRNEMIQSASATGLNSHKTIYYSQELDKLINIYQKHYYHMDRDERIFHNDKIV